MPILERLPVEVVAAGEQIDLYVLHDTIYMYPRDRKRGVWEWSDEEYTVAYRHALTDDAIHGLDNPGELQTLQQFLERTQACLVELGAPYSLRHLGLTSRALKNAFDDANGFLFKSMSPSGYRRRNIVLWPRDLKMQDWYVIQYMPNARRTLDAPAVYRLLRVRYPESLPVLIDFFGEAAEGPSWREDPETARGLPLPYLDVSGLFYLASAMACSLSLPVVSPQLQSSFSRMHPATWLYTSVVRTEMVVPDLNLTTYWWCGIETAGYLMASLSQWQMYLGLADRSPLEVFDYLLRRFADPSWPRLADRLVTPLNRTEEATADAGRTRGQAADPDRKDRGS